ncbi:MAG: hypothetical protein ACXWM7_06395 [Parachlamydiaceae bacterium]
MAGSTPNIYDGISSSYNVDLSDVVVFLGTLKPQLETFELPSLEFQIEEHEPLSLETRIKQLEETSKQLPFNPGTKFRAVGEARPIDGPEFKDSPFEALGAKRHYVNGDGSCWARALWQCTFSQIFANNTTFNHFIDKINKPRKVNEQDIQLNQYPDKYNLDELIHILFQLKNMSEQERIDYLNRLHVDNTLVFFMRDISAEYMKCMRWDVPPAHILDIKQNKSRYGGPEIGAFANYFNLQTHRIVQNSQKVWIYHYYGGQPGSGYSKPIAQLIENKEPIPHHCMFGVNDDHYEYISFDRVATDLVDSQNLEKSFNFLANEIAQQIEKDHLYALQLQKELNASLKHAQGDLETSRVLKADFENALCKDCGLDSSTLFASTSYLIQGDQRGCHGGIAPEEVTAFHRTLNERAAEGIQFGTNTVKELSGGTCSPMSLNFLDQFSKFFETADTEQIPFNHITAEFAIEQIDRTRFQTNGLMRNIQAAFNTISRKAQKVTDFGRAKMESLSRFFALTIRETSKEIDLRKQETLQQDCNALYDGLADGKYVVRQILPDNTPNSPKGELHGHTCALIKAGHILFFYDPNYGVHKTLNANGEILLKHLQKAHKNWTVPLTRLYQVERDHGYLADNNEIGLLEKPQAPKVEEAPQPAIEPKVPASPTTAESAPLLGATSTPSAPASKPESTKARTQEEPSFASRISGFISGFMSGIVNKVLSAWQTFVNFIHSLFVRA